MALSLALVGIMNAFIVAVDGRSQDIWHKEHFHLLEVRPDDGYMLRFIRFHQQDITISRFHLNADLQNVYYLVLRNMVVA